MAINLIDLLKGQIGPDLINQVSTHLGEENSNVSKAIHAFLPAILGGLANHSEDVSIFNNIKNIASSDFDSTSAVDSDSVAGKIKSIINSIFGGKTSEVSQAVAGISGISPASANQILDLTGGSTFGFLGKYINDNNLDKNQFVTLLNDQKPLLSGLLPAGLSLAGLGLGGLTTKPSVDISKDLPKTETVVNTPKPVINPETEYVDNGAHVTKSGDMHTPPPSSGGGSVLKWLLPLILLLAIGFFLWKQCDKKNENAVPPVATANNDSVVAHTSGDSATTITRESVVVTLPSGKTLNAYKGGIEDQIVTFLKSDEYKNATEDQLKDRWFNFDNLNFEFNKSTLVPESMVQVENLKAILAEFPEAKIKIGAYTDKKGDDAANLKISGERAVAVKNLLASNQVKEAEGYGAKFAKVPADASDKERESDRKTAIRFIK